MSLRMNSRQLPKGWVEKKLGDICSIKHGFAFKSQFFTSEESDYVLLTPGSFYESGGYREQGEKTKYYIGKIPDGFILNKNDFLFAMTEQAIGLLGNPLIVPELNKFLHNQRLGLVQVFDRIDWHNDFFFYQFNTQEFRAAVQSSASGVKVRHTSPNKLGAISIRYPPSIVEQKAIADNLNEAFAGIDRAIANTKKNLTNARELFESYLQALDAEKKPLGSLVDIKTGKLDANAATENGQYSFFTCSRETYSIDSFAFDCEAILLAGNNAVGDFNVKHYKGKFNAYQRTYVITVNKENRVLYRYLYFQLLKSLKAFKLQAVGVGTKFLKLGMIKDLQIALPTIEEQQEIVFMLDALATETQHLEAIYQQKLAALNELKQSILQKAFTGELTADTANQTTKKAEEAIAA